ncbi:MAG: dihydroneopterin aldolase [Bacteroidales bacterium 36-12]|jgi:dihydroneopterin aldolase|nr:MAG: dihydroneopterin aldolase [Bacteroidales bacterium 36-12]
MAKIILEDMEFHAYHGVYDFEKTEGNTFLVTAVMDIDIQKAGVTDNLDDTLNYQSVYDVIKSEMLIPSDLIEHISQRILGALKKQFPQIKHLTISLSKLNPPLGGKVEKVTVVVEG